MTNTFRTSLQDINDDCLLELFSSKYLDPMDLCSLAETCTRFKLIAQRLFPKSFSIKHYLEDDYNFQLGDYSGTWKSAHNINRVFKNFGSCLSTISISSLPNVLHLVAMHCDDTLNSLKIVSINVPDALTVKLKPIFKHLQKLVIAYATIDANLFASCDSLIELKVVSCTAILVNYFPKLERFSYQNIESNKSFHIQFLLTKFISCHKSLKAIYVYVLDNEENSILGAISNYCKELEKLEMKISNDHEYPNLQNLNQLRELKLFCGNSSIRKQGIRQLRKLKSLEILKVCQLSVTIPDLSSLTNLHELHLSTSYGSIKANELPLLTQLRKLHIYDLSSDINVLDIIKRLTSLEELKIHETKEKMGVLTEKLFTEIVNFVKGRSTVLTLICKFNFCYYSNYCDENRRVRLLLID